MDVFEIPEAFRVLNISSRDKDMTENLTLSIWFSDLVVLFRAPCAEGCGR